MINREGELGTGKNRELIKKLTETNDHSKTDLSGHKLFNLNLSNKDFSKCSFEGADLEATNLAHSNLSCTDLTDANLKGTHLLGCNFKGAKRSGRQILKYASISVEDRYYYAFLCKGNRGIIVFVSEPNKPEYEFKRGNASQMGAILYNFLVNA